MNKENIIHILCLVAAFFAGLLSGWKAHESVTSSRTPAIRTDTVTVRDTLRLPLPPPVAEEPVKYVPVTDTVTIRDTVMIPILQKVYQSPDYRAWVSGYNAALDSIEIYPKTVTVNNFVKPRKWSLSVESMYGIKPFGVDLSAQVGYQFIPDRWNATLEAGYSFTEGGAEPFVGVGVSYRIW